MASAINFPKAKNPMDTSSTSLTVLLEAIFWIASACVSLLTTKQIITVYNYHLPWRLLLLQLLTTLGFVATRDLLIGRESISDLVKLLDIPNQDSVQARRYWTCSLFSIACTSLSWIFFYQSILHLPSLPTLLFLTAAAFLVDTILDHKWLGTAKILWFRIRVTCLLIACIVIIYDEYRLTVNGLAFAIPAMILAGVSRTFHRYRDTLSTTRSWTSAKYATIILATFITGIGTWVFEADSNQTASGGGFFLVLGLNLTATASSIILGGSMFIKMPDTNTDSRSEHATRYSLAENDVSTISLVGLTTAMALQVSIPPYLSIFQIMAFCGAAACSWGHPFANHRPEDNELQVELYNACVGPALAARLYPTDNKSDLFEQSQGLSGANHSLSLRHDLENASNEATEEEKRGEGKPPYAPATRASKEQSSTVRITQKLFMLIVVLAWLFTAAFSLSPTALLQTGLQNVTPALDTSYVPPRQLDIVVSMFKEPSFVVRDIMTELLKIPAIAQRSPRLLIYLKDDTKETDVIKILTGATEVVKLPNVGREGATYLHHIITRWDDLANHTFFLQADVHNPRELYPRIRDYYTSDTGMLSLGFSENVCDCNNCGDRWGWTDTSGIIPEVYKRVHNESCVDKPILLSYKGQFVASAARIRGNDRVIYEDLQDLTTNLSSRAHGQDYLKGRPDSSNAPFFGYTLERMWSILFQCSDESIAARCPTLLSGTRRWGSKSDCQCFDSVAPSETAHT